MIEEIDKDYNYEEESRKFNSQKKKQDKFDKDAESENIIRPEVNTNLQNQQHNNKQYKFDVDVDLSRA